MVMSQATVVELVSDDLLPLFLRERERLDRIDLWYRWDHELPKLPPSATHEHRRLLKLARTPWLGLVVTTVAQSLYVDGYRSIGQGEGADDSGPWRTWQANDFDNRQIAVHRAALAYGLAYVTVLPGRDGQDRATSVIRGVSPRNMIARYGDPADDDWPMYAIKVHVQPDKSMLIRLYDEEAVYYLGADSGGNNVEFISFDIHGADVCPIVRYANMLDLEGRSDGEVDPFITVAARINKTSYDRLLTQHFTSWTIRTVTGMEKPDDETEANRKKMQLRQDDILIAEDPDTKFGTLAGTPLDGFISAWKSDIEALAAVSQTPSHNLTGQMVNLSAEALAAARAQLTQKVFERQKAFGKSHVQALRLAAALEGDNSSAADVHARVTWQDMEIRSMSQAVDALGKAAQMLGIPPDQLWSRIPGVEKADVDDWREAALSNDPLARLQNTLERQAAPAAQPTVV